MGAKLSAALHTPGLTGTHHKAALKVREITHSVLPSQSHPTVLAATCKRLTGFEAQLQVDQVKCMIFPKLTSLLP